MKYKVCITVTAIFLVLLFALCTTTACSSQKHDDNIEIEVRKDG